MISRARWSPALAAALFLLTACVPGFSFTREAIQGAQQPLEATGYRFSDATVPSGLRVVAYQHEAVRNIELRATWATGGLPEFRPGVDMVASAVLDRLTPGDRGLEASHRRFALGTIYDVKVAADQLESVTFLKPSMLREAIRIEADRMEQPAEGLTEAMVAESRERLAVWREQQAGESILQRHLALTLAFPGSRDARLATPTAAELRAVSLAEVRQYLEALLRPERAIFVLAGPMDPAAAIRLVVDALGGKSFGRQGAQVAPYQARSVPLPVARPGIIREPVASGARRLFVAWALPGAGANLQPAEWVALSKVSGTLPGLLKSRGQRQHVSAIDVKLFEQDDANFLEAAIDLKPEADPEAVRAAVIEAASSLGIGSDWYRRWFAQALQGARYLSAHGRVPIHEVARSLRTSGDPDPEHRFTEARDALFTRRLGGVLAEYATPERAATVLFEPRQTGTGAAAADQPTAPFAPRDVGPPPEGVAAPGREAILNLPLAQGLDQARWEKLPNGVQVVVLPFGADPFVRIRYVLPGGAASGSDKFRATAALRELRKALPPACRGVGVSNDATGVFMTYGVAASSLRFALEALSCWRLDLAWSPGSATLTGPDQRIARGYAQLAEAGQFPRASTDDDWTRKYLTRTFTPDDAILVVSGKLDAEQTLAAIRTLFGSWRKPEGPPLPVPASPVPTARAAVVVDAPKSKSARVVVTVRLPNGSWTFAPRLVANELLASRMDRLGLANGVKLQAWLYQGSDDFRAAQVILEGDAERASKLIGPVLDQVKELANRPPAPLEFALAKWNVARELLYRDGSYEPMAFSLMDMARSGDAPSARELQGSQVSAVEAADVFTILGTALTGKEAVFAVGDQQVLVGELKKLGVTPTIIPAREKVDQPDGKVETPDDPI